MTTGNQSSQSLRVGVIYGGRSTEHEISIISGMQVMNFLAKSHSVIPFYITRDGRWLTGSDVANIEKLKTLDLNSAGVKEVVVSPDTRLKVIVNPFPKGLLGKPQELQVDVMFPVLHGMHGEDGTIQGLLELADIPYVGSGVMASAIGIDKVVTKQLLRANGIPVLEDIWFTRSEWEADEKAITDRITSKFDFPLIVKPARLGSSIGVELVKNTDELLLQISAVSRLDTKILIEPCITNLLEINCSVLGSDKPLPSVCEQPLRKQELLGFEDKYMHDEKDRGMEGAKRIIPAPISQELTEKIQAFSVDTFKALRCSGVARVDFLINQDDGRIYVNEINTLPGSISFYLWKPTGVNPEQLVNQLVEIALQTHQEKRRTKFTSDFLVLQRISLLDLRKD